jgi:hypothetical protein
VFGELLQRVPWLGKAATPHLQVGGRRPKRRSNKCQTEVGPCEKLRAGQGTSQWRRLKAGPATRHRV